MSVVRIHHAEKLLERAKVEVKQRNNEVAWKLLEEAHIFSQPFVALHLYVHWEMLSLAVRERNFKEVFGQIVRFFLAGPASLTKIFPKGNGGRSNVGMFQTVPLTARIERKLRQLEKLELQRIQAGGTLPKYRRQHPTSKS